MKLDVSFSSPLEINISVAVDQILEPQFHAVWQWEIQNVVVRGENMASTMQAGTTAQAAVTWVDQYGNQAKVDGPIAWASSDETILTVEAIPGPPENRAKVTSAGLIGPAQVQVTADADLGQGVKSITAILDVVVIAGEASAGEITLETGTVPGPVRGRK